METTYILKVAVDGRVTREPFDAADSLGQLQRAVGGYIERVPLVLGHDLFVDDEGLLARKAINRTLTRFVGTRVRNTDVTIAGDGAFAGHDGDGETVGLTEAECADLERALELCGAAIRAGKGE